MSFHFSIGGFFSGQFEDVLKSDELHFFVSDFSFPTEHQDPTQIVSIKGDMDSNNLLKYLVDLKWKRKYDSDCLDGIQWELTFKNENKKMKCYGSNAFPSDFGDFTTLLKKIITKHKIPNGIGGTIYHDAKNIYFCPDFGDDRPKRTIQIF